MKILMVLTSHDKLGNTGRKTGFWLEEGAAPYYVFRDAGVELTLASPKGGQPPVDPKSDLPENQTPAMARFKQDPAAQKDFANTVKLEDMRSENFDPIFYPGGHGPMWDLVDNPDSIALIESFYNSGKPVAAVCHSPARAASGDVPGRADREGQARHRLRQQRGRRGPAHARRAVPGGGRAEAAGWDLREGAELASTGDEIVDADIEPLPGQVRNINQHSLAGLIEECGGELKDWGVVRDDRSALTEAIGAALEWGDVVLLSGGSSMGAKDIALETILSFPDSEFIFHGISIAPGKPTIFAKACGKPILGLPGYPVSALVIFDLFAAPLIRRLGGENIDTLQRFSRTARAVLKTNVASQIGREDYVRVTLARQSEKLVATPFAKQIRRDLHAGQSRRHGAHRYESGWSGAGGRGGGNSILV